MLKLSLDFLSKLKDNNNKPWFEANKPAFEKAKSEFLTFTEALLKEVAAFDPKMERLQAKECVYRIYRDVRFSSDKTPYKTHFGAFFAEGGKKSTGPGYYVHIDPNEVFLGCGIYMPEAPILQKIRQEIDYNGDKLMEILNKPSFKKVYPKMWEEGKLSRPPKGYEASHQHIELLKLKSYICASNLTKEELLHDNAAIKIGTLLQEVYPFQEFLREAVA
jgi:uncharacterized protein (TIGR02453 family)